LLLLHGELSKSEVAELLSLNPKTAEHWLRTLKSEGTVEATEPGRGSKHTRYRLTQSAKQMSLFDPSETAHQDS
jgi:predicted ArsR family transcriptional regulator